ncbi:MAG: hypothetical protein LBT14_02615 [Treponema sp.]|jgi:hypothetical protein|nr:hypothetical protein [Treponema sp.]
MKMLTSCIDTRNKDPKDISKFGLDTAADGMRNCYEETCKYAEKGGNPPPDNTRSKSADRIARFREGISWGNIEDNRERILNSAMFKQSAILFIQCVLSVVYGERVTIKIYSVEELNNTGERYPGRQYFLASMKEALYGRDPRNEIIGICHRQALVGLLSSAGPIPVAENRFSLLEKPIDETQDLNAILRGLNAQDKRILMFWLANNERIVTQCDLYTEIQRILIIEENVPAADFAEIEQSLEIDLLNPGITGFLRFREHGEEMLLDRITLVPIRDDKAQFGYNLPPLWRKHDDLFYVFLPPLNREAIESSRGDNFTIKSIEKLGQHKLENENLVSITICCVMEVNHLIRTVCRSYTKEQIRYIKNFPSLSVYGPAPKSGWIARRDIPRDPEFPSPLAGQAVEMFGLKDIEFDGLNFEDTGDHYLVYCGEIPKWLGVRINDGDWLGALPLRVLPEAKQPKWEHIPVFIHTEWPSGTMTVAADIGSSRSVVLFRKDGVNDQNDVIIEKDQILGIPLTSSDNMADVIFGSMFFQPDKQHKEVQGKTPVGILTTNKFDREETEDLLLYKSGKLILLDPKSISAASKWYRSIISDIKAGENQRAMNLLTQGMLTMIVDRSLHLGCSEINIRLSYLKERYGPMKTAWNNAKNKIQQLMPELEGRIDINMWLPESLAIANRLRKDNDLKAVSGAAIVDIGDFSTDIALYLKDFKESKDDVKLKKNVSVLFAGRQILLQPIWDYLQFSKSNVNFIFAPVNNDDEAAINRLKTEIETRRRGRNDNMSENVRRDLLCLMDILRKENIPPALQNLFDICYLTEVIILKRLLKDIPNDTDGSFDIHLFGGGSSLIKANTNSFNWNAVLGRTCVIHNRSQEGNKLASGLLIDVQEDLISASEQARIDAENYVRNERPANVVPNDEELKRGYIRFLKNAQALKIWSVQDSNARRVDTGRLFNIKRADKNSPGTIDDIILWRDLYPGSMEFAMAGSTDDKEIIITLFAYKMAYSSAVAFYSRGRN